MRYFFPLIFISFVLSPSIKSQTCLSGGISFISQQSIDSFSVNYPGCTIIDGDVNIQASSGTLGLEGLSQIEQINGDLIINSWWELESLEGLNNLVIIQGDLQIIYLPSLENLSGLENLQSIGGSFYFNYNHILTDLKGLERLRHIGIDLDIGDCDALQSLEGLDSLQFIGRNLSIYDNTSLDTLKNLDQLRKVTSSILIKNNRALKHISSFNSLDSLTNKLQIESNTNLEKMAGFDNLKFIGDELNIRFNSRLKEIIGLRSLQTSGEISISANAQLANLDNFQSLTRINGAVSITNNALLANLSGLENLTFVERFISIIRNTTLQSISALKNVQHISGGIFISYLPQLKTLNGLENISATNGPIHIVYNDSLTDISAIANYDQTAITELIIRENPSLAVCDVPSLCQLLANPMEKLIVIQNNSSTCIDRQEVAAQCNVIYTPPISSAKSINWNWASHLKRTGEYAQTFPVNLFQDSQNNNYLLGTFSSDAFFNEQLLPFSNIGGSKNYFIAKYTPEGALIWAKNEKNGRRVISATIDNQDIIHVFATDSLRLRTNNTYFYEQYDTDWNHLSSRPILNYSSSSTLDRPKIAVDNIGNQYFLFRGDSYGNGILQIQGLENPLELATPITNWILKYTPNGELAWLDTIKSGGLSDYEIAFNEQNELTLAGYYGDTLSVQDTILSGTGGSAKHIYCLQYTMDGSLKWARTFGEGLRSDDCNDLVIKDNFVYITGTLGFGDYQLGKDTVSVLAHDPYLFKLDGNGEVVDYLILPLNYAASKGISIAFNTNNELIWIGEYAGKDALIQETFLPHKANYYFQPHLFLLTLDDDLTIESIHTIESTGNYEIPEIIATEDNGFLAAGYLSQEIVLGDTTFTSDFTVSNIYDVFLGKFNILDENCNTNYVLDNSGISTDQIISASQTITSKRRHVKGNVLYAAGENIILTDGFEVASGVEFTAKIKGCTPINNITVASPENNLLETTLTEKHLKDTRTSDITIFPNPTNGYFSITGIQDLPFNELNLRLFNLNGQLIELFSPANVNNINTSHLPKGIYILSVKLPHQINIFKKIVIQ